MRLRVSTRLKLETIILITTMLCHAKLKVSDHSDARNARLVICPICQISQITRRASLGLATNFDHEMKQKKVSFLCTFKNEKEFKGGIIACTQRAGILVEFITISGRRRAPANKIFLNIFND